MKKVNLKNEQAKRKFYRWLKEAMGRSESTIRNIGKAIFLYEDFTKHADFATYNISRAIQFKEWLKKREYREGPISIATYYTYLRYLRQFFSWLSLQPGYKRKITPDVVDYLRASKKEERIATQHIHRNFPTKEYVKKLVSSIEINSEVDQRDRAIISFAFLTGMRDGAIVTLPLYCFEEENLVIRQDPKRGVHTKFSKYIFSIVFNFDNEMLNDVIKWKNHLEGKGFGMQDPFFPRSRLEHQKDGLCFEPATTVEPVFWKGTGRIREIFEKRAENAGLPYYAPHTFRHLTIYLALKYCRNIEQLKALSQNFGHEDIITILRFYANYSEQEVKEILSSIDFSGEPPETLTDKIDRIDKFIKNQKNYLDKEH